MKNLNKKKKGFTLLEVLLVVAIIAILAGIVIVAINPTKQLGDTNNSVRRADVSTISNAIYQYALDNSGAFPTGIDATTTDSQVLGTGSGCNTTCGAVTTISSCLNLASDLVSDYIVSIPYDPKTGSAGNTDYYVNTNAGGRLIVGACDPEQSATIQVTR